jgi:NAD(P)-dependent dehydrogenase (short-subunit alcohol dehydrogenase family)
MSMNQADSLARAVMMITGAAGNLGRAVAMTMKNLGARLVLLDRATDRLGALFPELSASRDHFLASGVDVGSSLSVTAAVERTLSRFGRIDCLVHTVGGFRGGQPVDQTDSADWDALFDANFRSTLNTCRAVIPVMRRQGRGRIVNVASIAALRGEANLAAYCASKAAVVRLTESLSAELRPAGINVNCVLPGTLDTPQNRQAMPGAETRAWVQLEDVAAVVAFLCSESARAIHGAAIPLTGSSH